MGFIICRWKGPGERSGIAILDFTIPSGYAVPNGGTQNYLRRVAHRQSIRQGEARVHQVTVYFDYVSIYQCLPVGNVKEYSTMHYFGIPMRALPMIA